MRAEETKTNNGLNSHCQAAFLAIRTAARLVLGPTVHTALAGFLRNQRSAWNLRSNRDAQPSESRS